MDGGGKRGRKEVSGRARREVAGRWMKGEGREEGKWGEPAMTHMHSRY